MYLKSLELTGFKSFAKKTELMFNTPITAIVGPNGSGKSNIAEAFRFVLGEQSIKSMRGKRTEDLIFNGSKEFGRANRASVKVVFDNRKKLLNIDFDEVAVERVVYRDSSSEYLLNGSQVRLRDIIELLASAHIGASGHHIISQGEADKILNANIIERREMLEDALGLKIYQYKKEESGRKLERTEENIKSVESLRREIAPHIKFLKKQVEKIERTLELKEELKKLSKEYFKREKLYIDFHKRAIDNERKVPSSELLRFDEELEMAKKTLSHSDGKDKKSVRLLELEKKLSEARAKKDALTRELGRIEGAILSEERIIKKHGGVAEEAVGKMVPLREVEGIALEIETKIKNAETDAAPDVWKKILTVVKELLSAFVARHKRQSANDFGKESKEALEDFKKEKAVLENKFSELAAEEKSLTSSCLALKDEIEKDKDRDREAERAVFRIMASQNELRSTLSALKDREEKIRFIEEDFKRELQEVAILIGREALDFSTASVPDEAGQPISVEEILKENRREQEERKRTIQKIKLRIEDAGGGDGGDVLKEYKEASERDEFLSREIIDLEKSAASLKVLITELEEKLDVEFRGGVDKINEQFQKFFTLMFGGGIAGLSVVKEKKRKVRALEGGEVAEEILGGFDSEEAEAEEGKEGIDIEVSLPRKKTKGLMMLSGGERALTSIALLFAMSRVNPPPFIILDETDAALDEANSNKYGDMIEDLAKVSELILITHNRETMSRAGVLYGVTMAVGGISKLLSIKFDEAVAVAK